MGSDLKQKSFVTEIPKGFSIQENKPKILDILRDVSVQTEGLIEGQTPFRDIKLGEGGREKSNYKDTVHGYAIDWDAWESAPKDRKNFYYLNKKDVPDAIRKQYSNYLKNPVGYGMSEDSTLEDVVKKFDQENPKHKLNKLEEQGVDIGTKIKDLGSKFDLSFLNPFASNAHAASIPSEEVGEKVKSFVTELPEGFRYVDPTEDTTKTTGYFKALGYGLAHGLDSTGMSGGNFIHYLGSKTGSENLKKAGQSIYDLYKNRPAIKEGTPDDLKGNVLKDRSLLKNPKWWIYNVSQMAPALSVAIGSGATAAQTVKVGGIVLKWSPQLVQKLSMIGGAVSGGAAGGILEGSSTYRDMLDKGHAKGETEQAAELMAAATAGLNAISVGKFLQKLPKGVVGNIVGRAGTGLVEGITEWLEEPSEVIAKRVATGEIENIPQTVQESLKALEEGFNVVPPSILLGVITAGAINLENQVEVSDVQESPIAKEDLEVAKKEFDEEMGAEEEEMLDEGVVEKKADITVEPLIEEVKKNRVAPVEKLMESGYSQEEAEFINRKVEDMIDVKSPSVNDVVKNIDEYTRSTEEGTVDVYRVVPKGKDLELADYVFTTEEAATSFRDEYGYVRGQPNIIKKTVNIKDLLVPKEEGFDGEVVYLPEQYTPLEKESLTSTTSKTIDDKNKKIEELTEKKDKASLSKDVLAYVKEKQSAFKNRIKRNKDDTLKEEYAEIPVKYRTNKEFGITMDEAAQELRDQGEDVTHISDYLLDLDEQQQRLEEDIEEGRRKMIKRAVLTDIKKSIKDIKRGMREGSIQTRDSIRNYQAIFENVIKNIGLEPKDRAKLLSKIKNINNDETLFDAIKDLERRAVNYFESNEKNNIEKSIKKELKFTKPVKQGVRSVGKYDYETNVVFDAIRDINKLTKEKALVELEAMQDDNLTEFQVIKKKMLSLKANGKQSSVALFEQVLADIKRLKDAGNRSKSEKDFMDKVEKKEKKQHVISEMGRIKPEDVINWKTRAFNVYRLGMSHFKSVLIGTTGLNVAEDYDLQLAESEFTTKLQSKHREIAENSAKILGIKEKEYLEFLAKSSQNDNFLYENHEGGNKYPISVASLIDMYNSIKNQHTRERVYAVYGEPQINELLSILTGKQKQLADYLQEVAQSTQDVYNKYTIETTGRDMGVVDDYWMRTSEYVSDIYSDFFIQSNIPSASKARSSGNITPLFNNAFSKLNKHMHDAQYIESLNDKYMEAKRIFSDSKIKNLFALKYGEDIHANLMKKIEMLSLTSRQADLDLVTKWFGHAVNGWVVAKIGLSEGVLVKQLISAGNYMENMSSKAWASGFAKGLSNPKKTFDYMWNNSSYVRERFARGYSEAMESALREANALHSIRGNVFKFVSSFARAGDITAIVFGGYPMVIQLQKEGMSLEDAIKAFELATIEAQQSGLKSSRSDYQNSTNGFARMFLAFKNTSSQYMRKLVDARVMYLNGDMSAKQFAKVTMIYGIIQPALFGAVSHAVGSRLWESISAAFRDDEDEDVDYNEDLMKAVAISIVKNPFNAIPFLGETVESLARKSIGEKAFDPFGTGLLDDMARSWNAVNVKDKDAFDYFEIIGGVLEPGIGFPVKSPARKVKKLMNIRRYDHASKAHANFIDRYGEIKKAKKKIKEAYGDKEEGIKLKNKYKKQIKSFNKMKNIYNLIQEKNKALKNINKKTSISDADKERRERLRKEITSLAKKGIDYYDNKE